MSLRSASQWDPLVKLAHKRFAMRQTHDSRTGTAAYGWAFVQCTATYEAQYLCTSVHGEGGHRSTRKKKHVYGHVRPHWSAADVYVRRLGLATVYGRARLGADACVRL